MIGTPAACIASRAARLRAHQLDRLRRRPDPDEPRVLDRAGERGVLGEEAVAGVDAPPRPARSAVSTSLLDLQVALGRRRRRRSDTPRPRSETCSAHAVGLRIDGDRADPELAQRAEDADRDLAAVGDQDLVETDTARILSP